MQGTHGQLDTFSSMTTDVLISEVEIIWMLMPSRSARAEHGAGHADVAAHADADDADLADLGVAHHVLGAQRRGPCLEQVDGARIVVAVHGEAEVGLAVLAQVLDDDIDFDVGIGHGAEDAVGDAGVSGTPSTEILASSRLKAMPDTTACSIFSSSSKVIKVPDLAVVDVDVPGREAGEHAHGHLVLAGEFDRADLQHLAAQAGPFPAFPRSSPWSGGGRRAPRGSVV